MDWVRGTTSVCGVQPLCPSLDFTCEGDDLDCDDMTTASEPAIDCVLEALAAGASGRVSWSISGAEGEVGSTVELDLVGDGTLFRQGYYHFDGCWDTHAVEHLALPDPAYYQGCLAGAGWRARFDCLRAAPFAAPLATCIAGTGYASQQC